MHILVGFLIGVAVMTGFYEPREMPDGTYHMDTLAAAPLGGGRHQLPSLAEQKFANVTRQAYDYSCGSAALTTLMNHYLGESLTEMHVINGLLRYGDIQRISETRAFSLLDMKSLVEALGYEAHGYKTDIAVSVTPSGCIAVSVAPSGGSGGGVSMAVAPDLAVTFACVSVAGVAMTVAPGHGGIGVAVSVTPVCISQGVAPAADSLLIP
jgi:hypothetical protein